MSFSPVGGSPNVVTLGGALPATRQFSPEELRKDVSTAYSPDESEKAHRSRIETLMTKYRAEALAEKDLSESSLRAMGSEQRASTEEAIARSVQTKVGEMMERISADAAARGQSRAVFMNIRI